VYRKNARKIQEASAAADGLSAAAGLVEESLGLTHKVAQEISSDTWSVRK
jgi:hypothetical protein